MANEAIKVELYGPNASGEPRSMTVASNAAFIKYTLLTLADPRTVAAHTATGSGAVFGGIASMDKDGSDFSTNVSVFTNGIFDLVASGAIGIGQEVILAGGGANLVMAKSQLPNPASGAQIVGIALETVSDAEVFECRVNI